MPVNSGLHRLAVGATTATDRASRRYLQPRCPRAIGDSGARFLHATGPPATNYGVDLLLPVDAGSYRGLPRAHGRARQPRSTILARRALRVGEQSEPWFRLSLCDRIFGENLLRSLERLVRRSLGRHSVGGDVVPGDLKDMLGINLGGCRAVRLVERYRRPDAGFRDVGGDDAGRRNRAKTGRS
jgi:hypothetical protein